MNFFKLYIGDYQRDTGHLSVMEHGAYLLMLQHYYATERPLPLPPALYRLLRAQDRAERDAVDAVAAQFWTQTPDGLVNERADAEIAKAADQAKTNARIARDRTTNRATNRATNRERTVNEPSTNRQPNQTPDTRHQTEEKTHAKGDLSDTKSEPVGFEPAGLALDPGEHPPDPPPSPPTMAAAVCVAMRSQGIGSTNPGHPKLIALLDAGAQIDAFVGAAREARDRGKGFAYALGIVGGQLAQAEASVAAAAAAATRAPQRNGLSAAERAAEAVARLTGRRDGQRPMRTIDANDLG